VNVLIEGTVAATVYDELVGILRAEQSAAEEQDQAAPTWSQVLELILRKGVKAYQGAEPACR
jgi:hypothetical protein